MYDSSCNYDRSADLSARVSHRTTQGRAGKFPSDSISGKQVVSNDTLNENQSYIYIANEQYCKEDSIEYMLDLSPGLGNYLLKTTFR